ncbi:MAG: SPASM domain-containing protein [Candidatus Aminicenantes bacterium]|nr:SPASM domain-containing protein [Candidatus Aminicenantes bacterium]
MICEQFQWNGATISIPARGLPPLLYVELSSRCNFSCPGCFRGSNSDREEQDLSQDVINTILSCIDPEKGVRRLFLGGIGEPFLHPGINSFVQEAAAAGAAIAIQSNGSLIDEKAIRFLVEIGVEKLIISYETGGLDHAAQKEHVPRNTELAGFPLQIIREIKRQKKEAGTNRPIISMEWVLSADSVHHVEEFIAVSIREGVEELLFSNLLPTTSEFEKQVLYSLNTEKNGKEILSALLKPIRHRIHYTMPNFFLSTERYCPFIEKSSAVVRSDGALAPCYRLLHNSREIVAGKEMALHPFLFGSLKNTSLEELWNSRDYLWFRFSVENSLYPSCLDCSLREGCEYLVDSDSHCWGGTPSCGNCLWSRRIILCP